MELKDLRDEVKRLFKEIFSSGVPPHIGKLEGATHSIGAAACPDGTDNVAFYAIVENDVVEDITYECGNCDPYMFVAADSIVKLSKGKTLDEISKISAEDVLNFINCPDEILYNHTTEALKILKKMLVLDQQGESR